MCHGPQNIYKMIITIGYNILIMNYIIVIILTIQTIDFVLCITIKWPPLNTLYPLWYVDLNQLLFHVFYNYVSDADLSRDGQNIADACTEYLLEALDHLCTLNHEPEEHTVGKVLAIIADCREPVFREFLIELRKLFTEYFTQDEFILAGCQPLVDWVWGNDYSTAS